MLIALAPPNLHHQSAGPKIRSLLWPPRLICILTFTLKADTIQFTKLEQCTHRLNEHLLHTAALCADKYGKVCANILRSLSNEHSPNQYHYVFSLLAQNPKTKQFLKSIPPFALCVPRKCLDKNGLRA
jgi:hypothetical protein